MIPWNDHFCITIFNFPDKTNQSYNMTAEQDLCARTSLQHYSTLL